MRWKARPGAAQLREELADFWEEHGASWAESSDPAFREIAAAHRHHAQNIRDGQEVHLAAWLLPAWAQGDDFTLYDQLILGEDNILRLDPDFYRD